MLSTTMLSTTMLSTTMLSEQSHQKDVLGNRVYTPCFTHEGKEIQYKLFNTNLQNTVPTSDEWMMMDRQLAKPILKRGVCLETPHESVDFNNMSQSSIDACSTYMTEDQSGGFAQPNTINIVDRLISFQSSLTEYIIDEDERIDTETLLWIEQQKSIQTNAHNLWARETNQVSREVDWSLTDMDISQYPYKSDLQYPYKSVSQDQYESVSQDQYESVSQDQYESVSQDPSVDYIQPNAFFADLVDCFETKNDEEEFEELLQLIIQAAEEEAIEQLDDPDAPPALPKRMTRLTGEEDDRYNNNLRHLTDRFYDRTF
jgi:hypothetical protein